MTLSGETLAVLLVNIWGLLIWTGLFPQSWRPSLAASASRAILGWSKGSSGWVGRGLTIAMPWGAAALDFFALAGVTNVNFFNWLGAAAAIVFACVALVAIPKWALPPWFRQWLVVHPNEGARITTLIGPLRREPPIDSAGEDDRQVGRPEPRADAEPARRWTPWAWIAAILATFYAFIAAFAWALESDLGWSGWPRGQYVLTGVEVLVVFIAPVALVLALCFPFHSWRWGLWLTWPQLLLGFAIHRGCPIAPPCTASDPEPALMPFALTALVCTAAWCAAAARRRGLHS